MIALRVGLVLAVALTCLGLIPSLIITPDPDGDLTLPIAALVLSVGITVATLALLVPAWRGGRRAAAAIAILQLVLIVSALPAFFLPSEFVPADGVLSAVIGSLLNVTAFTLIMLLFSNALLYTAAVIVVVAVYAGLNAVLLTVLPEIAARTVQTLSAIVVAVAFQPVLTLVRRTVGRSLYGGRAEPATTALQIGSRLGSAADGPESALSEIRGALRLPGLELLHAGRAIAASGAAEPLSRSVELPMGAGDRLALLVWLRPGERRLGHDDRAALELVAAPLALLVRSTDLTAALRTARAATVEARERERSTLHRDLHDGLGPLLTSAAFRADAAQNLLAEEPVTAGGLLTEARGQIRAALAEVRRVVYGLRPLELEERGLWGALENRVAQPGRLAIELLLPDPRPDISPAVELAAYRIVNEALANAERHSTGSTVRIVIAAADADLHVEVTDDGVSSGWTEGVGIRSIRERAEELDGLAEVGATPRGWTVSATLPL